MLYPKNQRRELTRELFERPTSEYRGTPFWAWNAKLNLEELTRQIDVLKDMGMGGFHIHSRSGMATKYLSDDFMKLVKGCRDKAEKEEMLCWLYDEDRWPSGAAGGFVTKDRAYSARHLLFTMTPYGEGEVSGELDSRAVGSRQENGKLLAVYKITLENGYLLKYERVADDTKSGAGIWYAYLETAGPSPWYNNETYLNTLDPKAVEKFVEVTHERYKQSVGESFGGVIPSIFTDEPQFSRKETLGFADARQDVTLPYTDDLNDTFKAAYQVDLLAHLPELFWDLPNGEVSVVRYQYHDHIAERFASAFADTVGNWCRANGIMLTGHMMEEPTLESQTAALGDAMRSYRSFQLPGIDMLCDGREFTTAKQAQSATHQYGYPGVLSELYGVTNWDFDFRGHKLQGDWQAALGVTTRVHHLSWVSMGGEAKRDYPATINYQAPWHLKYRYVEDYFARVNTALTRGVPCVTVGVIHPVESYWLRWGPREQTAQVREAMDAAFTDMAEWLLTGLIDYDYISESLLPEQCEKADAPFNVGKMRYDVVVVPDCETLRTSTVERLEDFVKAGGRLIFAGRVAHLVDARPSDRVKKLAKISETIPMDRIALLDVLEAERAIDVRDESGARTDKLLHQMRDDGDARWLFLCQAYNPENKDVTRSQIYEIRIKGEWTAEKWDALTGEIVDIEQEMRDGITVIKYRLDAHDSLLLKLKAGGVRAEAKDEVVLNVDFVRTASPVAITLDEPNVLMLDQAEYRIDGGEWQGREEILRIDNIIRAKLNWPSRSEMFAQPWVTENRQQEDTEHTLALRFRIDTRVALSGAKLAVEDSESIHLYLDGEEIDSNADGWYVDKAIDTIPLPRMSAGVHELIVEYEYKRPLNVEWCYLIGDFGVTMTGDTAYIHEKVEKLYYGDWTRQGLPFYGGNVTYHVPVECGNGGLTVRVPQYRGAVTRVALDGVDHGIIAYAPYEKKIPAEAGAHMLSITVYGSRVNTFGAVHNADDIVSWFGPNAWRSTGVRWSYEYRLKPCGLLTAPMIYR